jgi:transposase
LIPARLFGACSVALLWIDAMLGDMTIQLHHPEDLEHLRQRVAWEKNAKQRDRYRAVLLVAEHSLEGDDVAERLGRSPRFVDEWVGRYRSDGIDALVPRKQPGQRPKLTPDQEVALKARFDAGPRPEDGVCTLRGKDIVRIIEAEFGRVGEALYLPKDA